MQNNIKNIQGFTLVELLLVITMIGILSATIFAMMGDSNKAKSRAMMSSMRSVLPFVQECKFKGEVGLGAPNPSSNGQGSGDKICVGSDAEWPAIDIAGCQYGTIGATSLDYNVNCGTCLIKCTVENSARCFFSGSGCE